MKNINFSFTIDTLTAVIVMNVVLTGLHYVLYWIYQKKKYAWSNTALNVINFLMAMVAIVIGNRRHPDDAPEVKK